MARRHDDPPPSYYEPPEGKTPRCPICMAECDTLIVGYWGNIVGCTECTREIDAYEYEEDDG